MDFAQPSKVLEALEPIMQPESEPAAGGRDDLP